MSDMKNSFSRRQTRYGINAVLYALAGLAILVVVNLIVARMPTQIGGFQTDWRWDLTATKRFSLSLQTTKILGGLDRDIQILYFDRKNNLGGSVKDLLDQFPAQSRKVSIQMVELDREPATAAKYNAKEYGSIVVSTGEKHEVAKGAREEDIANAIVKALKGEAKSIYFLQGHGERDIANTERQGYSAAKKALEESNYTILPLSLLSEKPQVPKDAALVVIAGADKNFLDPEITALKEYLVKGGRLFVLITPTTPPALVKFLAEFGADVSNALVVDVSGIGRLFGTDELMPLAVAYEPHAITKDMANVATLYPLAGMIAPSVGFLAGADFRLIAKTPSQSWATREVKSKQVSFQKGRDIEGPIGIVGAGTFKDPTIIDALEGRLVVAGSPDVISNAILAFNGNRDLFLNSVAWLSSDEDLISIRPRDPEDRRIELTPGQLTMIKYLSLGGIPLAIILSGLGVWWKRRG
ncbi:MAG: hypothetical protein EXQ56_12380 [Acidobacteria bacterium]|nr:hypothetical protein [Acidobacteriota bacterium]